MKITSKDVKGLDFQSIHLALNNQEYESLKEIKNQISIEVISMTEGFVASVNSEIPIVITTDQNVAMIESNHLANALEVENDLCQILVPKKNDHQIILARTRDGKLIIFCYLTMMELFQWSDDKVTDIVLIEDENDPILKLLMVVESTKDKIAGETFLQIVQYPNFDLLYRLKVTPFCKLLDVSLNQETPLFVEGSFEALNDENSDLNVSKNEVKCVQSLRIRGVTEGNPEARLSRLLAKKKFDEAEK